MHSYLRAVGFSKIKNKRMLNPILKSIIANPTKRTISTISTDTRIIQLDKDFGEGIGLSMVGELDLEGNVSWEYHFPYVKSRALLEEDRIFIEKHGDKQSYAGVCENYNLSMTLIFFMTNVAEYENTKWLNYSNHLTNKATLAGLATSGKVLLNVEQESQDALADGHSTNHRSQMIKAAKNGDKDAMEKLTIEDMDMYQQIGYRLKSEDIFSIVETSFIPFGIETEHYSVVGNILDCKTTRNVLTDEEIFLMSVESNDTQIQLAINKEDLLGEPAPGLRFKGEVWLQGHVFF